MTMTVSAIFEDGVFRPLEPVHLHEGQIVQVPLPQRTDEQIHQENIQELQTLIAEWLAHPDDYDEGEEVPWEEFHAFLQANRFDLPERDLGLDELYAT